jgi:hypothetical protein
VIAVDQKSGQVVIASATCVPQEGFAKFPAKGLMDVQAIVVPGRGVAAAQAGVDNTRANQRLVHAELQKGTDPKQIIELLKADRRSTRALRGILGRQEQCLVARSTGSGTGHRHLFFRSRQYPRERRRRHCRGGGARGE